MRFTSLTFAAFVGLLLVADRAMPLRFKTALLLAASYAFYGFWDWRFIPLLMFATATDYLVGLRVAPHPGRSDRTRRWWLAGSIATQVGILAFFKYADFAILSVAAVLRPMGAGGIEPLHLILPLGISFYTFKTLTYTIDVYRGHVEPTRDPIAYALHVSFFATIVAGPIERARDFLPQLTAPRRATRDDLADGAHLIFWGVFKKIVVADNIAPVVATIFDSSEPTGFGTIVGAAAFALQLFCDFSGYTDMARGCGACLGFRLSENFRAPYLARSPSEFWQRWHITLSSWLRDYLFQPLGGALRGLPRAYRNLLITMVIAGLWHGAAWTFVLWGAYWGVLLVGHRVLQPVLKRHGAWFRRNLPRALRDTVKVLVTVLLVCFGWLLFRSPSVSQFGAMVAALFEWHGPVDWSLLTPLLRFGGLYLTIESALLAGGAESLRRLPVRLAPLRTALYAVLAYMLLFYGTGAGAFIYAQF